jgi:hypothetical protein
MELHPERLWVLLSSPNDRCATEEVNLFVSEHLGVKPFQASLRCPRCAGPLTFDGVEPDR